MEIRLCNITESGHHLFIPIMDRVEETIDDHTYAYAGIGNIKFFKPRWYGLFCDISARLEIKLRINGRRK